MFCGWCSAGNGCAGFNPSTAKFSITDVLYQTYSDCISDVASVSCTIGNAKDVYGYFNAGAISCAFGSQSISLSATFRTFIPQTEPVGFSLSGFPACDENATTIFRFSQGANSQLPESINPAFYTKQAVTAAITSVFTPAAICAPFSANANPPYLCTGTERASIFSIILQSLSLYTTSIGILFASYSVWLTLPRLFGKKPAAAARRRFRPQGSHGPAKFGGLRN